MCMTRNSSPSWARRAVVRPRRCASSAALKRRIRDVVYFDGKAINDVPPHKRRVNTVFQRYALFTHLNVFENIAFGLRVNRSPTT